ncbi:MAG: VWA domain-containing protein [Legionella sp.]|nr:VWA domain-containing protein [Legionella sp.]
MFEFSDPWVLLLLPLPFVLRFILPAKKATCSAAVRVPFFSDIIKLQSNKRQIVFWTGLVTWYTIIWTCLVLALAGPRWIGKLQPLTREGHNIMLALDLSGSMALNDMRLHGTQVMRLTVVKETAKQFIQQRAGDRLGLVLFGTRAYLQTPLTYDHLSVLQRLDEAVVGLAGQTTSLGDALGLAIKHLKKTPEQARLVILLTDGANNSGVLPPLKAAELAQSEKVKVYTIGLGSQAASALTQGIIYNRPPGSDLDETTLKAIAKMTNGHYFRATDTQSLSQIYQKINALEALPQDYATVRPQQEYYVWPLSLAFLVLMLWLSKEVYKTKKKNQRMQSPKLEEVKAL